MSSSRLEGKISTLLRVKCPFILTVYIHLNNVKGFIILERLPCSLFYEFSTVLGKSILVVGVKKGYKVGW